MRLHRAPYKLSFVILTFIYISFIFAAEVSAQAAGGALKGAAKKTVTDDKSESLQESRPSAAISEIAAILDKGKVKGVSFKDTAVLKSFYEERNYKTAWVNNSLFAQLSPSQGQPEAILNVLENAWQHGLNPKNYHVDVIKELVGGNTLSFAVSEAPILDVIMSDAMVRYGQDMTGMRVEAGQLDLHSRYWRQPLEGSGVLKQIKDAKGPVTALESFQPSGELYKALKIELEKLYRTAVTDEETMVRLKGILRPGSSHEAVLDLRKRMGFQVDKDNPSHFLYNDELAQSVMALQEAHGLKADGILGPQTLAVMNKTRDDRINQVLVNMDRLRWLDQRKPERYVVVNVPAAKLWAIENGSIAFDMKVVVGRYKRQTNIFNTNITGIRFNPTWTVPPTIKEEDFLPALQSDPLYLADRGIEVVYKGNTLDPTTVDWTAVGNNDLHGIQMVQQPGTANPLGKIRVFMPNPYNIYLHDTNKRSYFSRSDRALSSGCVRMEDAMKIAQFVMKNNEGWSDEIMNKILASGKKTDIAAEVHVPVYLLYQTMWFGDNGQLVYGHDIYDRDIVLRRALDAIDGVGYPEIMSVSVPAIPAAPQKVAPAKRVIKTKKKEETVISEAHQATDKPGSLSFFSNMKITPKQKDGIDLLTFNE